jgi:hypothetical protein
MKLIWEGGEEKGENKMQAYLVYTHYTPCK